MEYATAILLGLVGSFHCAGMCGPLAIASAPRSGRGFVAGRIAYNLGRVVTYCVMGLAFGWFGKALLLAGLQRTLSIALGVLLLAGLLASRKVALWRPVHCIVERIKTPMASCLRRGTFRSQAALGLLNGLLPCGLVYVAAAGATATGGIISGALYMAAFGSGTLPMMLALSLSAHLLPLSWRLRFRGLAPVSIALLAALLILRGLSLGIPYVSPEISGGQANCH